MKTFVVSLDPKYPSKQPKALHDHLRLLKLQQLQSHLWAGENDGSASRLKQSILPFLQPGDGLVVFASTVDDYESLNPVR